MVRFSNIAWKILFSSLLFCPSLSFADGGSEANCQINDFWVLSRPAANLIYEGCKEKHSKRYDIERNGSIYSAITEFTDGTAKIYLGTAAACSNNLHLNSPDCDLILMTKFIVKHKDTTIETLEWGIDVETQEMLVTDLIDSPDPNNPGKRIIEGVRSQYLKLVPASIDSTQFMEWMTYIELLDSTLAQQIDVTEEFQRKKLEQKNKLLDNTTFPAQSHLRLRLSELADEYEREGSAIKFINFIRPEIEDLNPYLDR